MRGASSHLRTSVQSRKNGSPLKLGLAGSGCSVECLIAQSVHVPAASSKIRGATLYTAPEAPNNATSLRAACCCFCHPCQAAVPASTQQSALASAKLVGWDGIISSLHHASLISCRRQGPRRLAAYSSQRDTLLSQGSVFSISLPSPYHATLSTTRPNLLLDCNGSRTSPGETRMMDTG